jgi:AcrR family transcriptional regulator
VALALAEENAGWYDLRLHRVARRLGVPLAAVLAHFRDTDAIADAWFARALHAMLHEPEPGFGTQPGPHLFMALLVKVLRQVASVADSTLPTRDTQRRPHR